MHRKIRVLPLVMALLLTIVIRLDAYASGTVRVGFIDTGISTKYIDAAQVAGGKNYVFPEQDTEDRVGHGTATAGMMLGSLQLDIKGSCPHAVAVPLVTYDRYLSGVVKNLDISVMCQAIYDAIDVFGCRVINISMGIPIESEQLALAVEYADEKGVVVVSATGNDNLLYPQRSYYPAVYPTVIGVGSTNGPKDTLVENTIGDTSDSLTNDYAVAGFSQRNGVSVMAEGVNVRTITNRNEAEAILRSGTSYSCAYVAGLCAQLLVDSPSLNPAQVRALLYASAQDIGTPGVDAESGWGVVGLNSSNPEPMTRGILIALLHAYDGEPESGTSGFDDVSADAWYADAVEWASANGIVSGYGNSRFQPDKNITREQVVAILYRYAQYKGYDVFVGEDTNILSYEDAFDISEYAISAIQWACGADVIQDSDGKLMPQGEVSRTEAVAILHSFFENVAK